MNSSIKLPFSIKFILIFLLLSFESFAAEERQIVIGSDEAKIKIKIFSSHTCPHCANFHTQVVPKIKENYVKTGQVQLIFIDFPLDEAALNASILLHCLNKEKQLVFLDEIYISQTKWTTGSNIKDINKNLKKIAKNYGMTEDKFEKCLLDVKISDKILNKRIEAHRKYAIDSTPTIIINEKKLEGSKNFENIKKKIEKII
tara:strand:- start:23 stop:625 length:603 start_codon:yes stop_codon:yes gene_type:complete